MTTPLKAIVSDDGLYAAPIVPANSSNDEYLAFRLAHPNLPLTDDKQQPGTEILVREVTIYSVFEDYSDSVFTNKFDADPEEEFEIIYHKQAYEPIALPEQDKGETKTTKDMEENSELKAYVFAQYIGSDVYLHQPQKLVIRHQKGDLVDYQIKLETAMALECELMLRPLSSIKDDEAIEVAKLVLNDPQAYKGDYIITIGKRFSKYNNLSAELPLFKAVNIHQYLQQQGFALPIFYKGTHYSVEKLVELGIIIVK